MAAEFVTPGGLWVPPSALDRYSEGKSDRSAGAQVRALTGMLGGSTGSGVSRFREYQNYLNALKIPWVYRCVMTIASSFASSEWDLMDADKPITSATNPFLQLIARPNPVQTEFSFLELQEVYMGVLGEVFISLENKDSQGRPREMYVLNPMFVTVYPDATNYVKGYSFSPANVNMTGFKPIPYDPDEIIHIKLPNPSNPYRGFGPVEASATVLDIIDAMGMHELGYYRSGGRIVGVLETEDEVGDDDFEKIKQEWRQFSSDQASRMKTAILQAGLKYTPIAEGMKAINQVEINKEKRGTILGTWGVPPTKLGILEDAQYKLNDADQTFESETMLPKKKRFEDAIQTLIDLFDPDWRWQFDRKNFEDDATRLNNARAMSQVWSFTVNDILDYCGFPKKKGGDVVYVPSQMVATKIEDMENSADINLENLEAPDDTSGDGGAPVVPEDSGPGSNNGTSGNGASPNRAGDQPAPSLTVVKSQGYEIKELKDAFVKAGEMGERDETGMTPEQKVIGRDILRKEAAVHRVGLRFQRRFQGTDQKARKARRVSQNQPGLGAAKLEFRGRFIKQAGEVAVPEIKKAFRVQRRKVVQAVEDIVSAAKKLPERDEKGSPIRHRFLMKALGSAIPSEPMEDAVRALHVSALVQGFRDGAKLLDVRHAELLRQKIENAKESRGSDTKAALPDYIPADAPDWRGAVEAWRGGSFPFLENSFEKMADRVTGIDDTTRSKIADTLEEGMHRGYSSLQLANGYDLEGYKGVAGVFDMADEYRAELIARTEARDAFEKGTLSAYGMAEIPAVEAMDGDEFDEACKLRDGTVYPLSPAPPK